MISGLRGVLEDRGPDWVVVNVAGVGYKAYAPTSTLSVLGTMGEPVRLYTHLIVTQESLALYGFATREELRLFETLQTVNGVGPRLALALLSALSPEALVAAIASGDEAGLQRVPGVGKKTAGRLVLELKGKLEKEWGVALHGGATPAEADGDALAALVGLGYTPAEARYALAQVPAAAKLPLEERVRQALQSMGRR